ncbi:hypothetical protein K0U27_02040 [archaeon]|nr:hypothetical protein [archaeon]
MKETPFDFHVFDDKVHENYLAFQGALQTSKDHQSESLLQTNFFQNILKDSIECLLQSKESRRTPVKLIVSILENKGILSTQEAKDAMKICQIRDDIAHCIDFKSIEGDLDKLIRTMDLGFPVIPLEEEEYHLDKVIEALHSIARNSLTWNMYQRLDYICHMIAGHIQSELYELREPNPLVSTEYEPPLTDKDRKEIDDYMYHSNNDIP